MFFRGSVAIEIPMYKAINNKQKYDRKSEPLRVDKRGCVLLISYSDLAY